MRGLLYRSIRPLTVCRNGQEHIWFRVPGNNNLVSSARVAGKPFDLLIRVPASTLSNNKTNFNSKENTSCNIQPWEFNSRTLQNVKFLLVPRRKFGLGRKDPPFGHAKFRGRIVWVEPLVFAVFFITLTSLFIDWRTLKEEYGITILPDVIYRAMTQGIDGEGQVIFILPEETFLVRALPLTLFTIFFHCKCYLQWYVSDIMCIIYRKFGILENQQRKMLHLPKLLCLQNDGMKFTQ